MKTQLTLTTGYYSRNLHFHILGFCLICISACSMFKEKSFYETDSLQRQEMRKEIRFESAATSQALRIYSSSDSSDRQSYAEIYPKGNFRYSPSGGFSGEAERLIINESLRLAKTRNGSLQTSQSEQSRTGIKETAKSQTRTQLKEKHLKPRNLSWAYLAGCGLIFLLAWIIRKKL